MLDHYTYIDNIDFSRLHAVFHSLPLFDDLYLNMQGMNIAINDSFITKQEYLLLESHLEIEKTPAQQALFVSAQSQMWIFGLYELLRTWNQRIRKLRDWKQNKVLDKMLSKVSRDSHNLAALMRARHIVWVRDNHDALEKIEKSSVLIDPIYKITSDIRINLAKHEIPGKNNSFVRSPGYGRINPHCGALDFNLDLGDNSYDFINRRDIADALRKVEIGSN